MKTVIDLVTALKTYFTGKDTAAKQAVEANIAPVETDASSSAAPYSVGDQLILNDILYDVTASISISDALIVGTNIAAASDLSTQIGGKQDQIEVTSMPTASASNVGQVLIYIGATTSTYTSGQSYQSTYEGGAYIWKPAPKAKAVSYDGTQSGSSETDVQGAIDDLYSQNQTLTNQVTDISEVMGKNGAKNKEPFDIDVAKALNTTGTWTGNSYALNGITFAFADDGKVTVSGTASALCSINISGNYDLNGDYIITGCPSGGGISTYSLRIYDSSATVIADDIGEGISFTANNLANCRTNIIVRKDAAISTPIVFAPMIRDSKDPDATYQPYAKTNQELTAENRELTKDVEGIKKTVAGTFTVEPSLTAVAVGYTGFNYNDVLGNIKGIVTLQEDISADSWITIGTLSKAPTIFQQLPAISITPDNGTKGKSNNATYSIGTDGTVKFNLRYRMVTGDQFGLWATFPM